MAVQIKDTTQDLNDLNLVKEVPAEIDNNLAYKEELRNLPEVERLTNEIDVNDLNTILAFGQKPSAEISKVSDEMLSSMKAIKTTEVSEMITQLTKLMDKFDIKELSTEEEKTIFNKIFNKVKNSLDDMFKKYEDMGAEVDKIAQILTRYKIDIAKTNDNLTRLLNSNISYFQQLEKYIVAGEIGVQQIDDYIRNLSENQTNTSVQEKQMIIQQLENTKQMLEQRVVDLQTAENVAMQSCPMIMTMQNSNANLIRKINSSFIITLPIFKQCLIHAITLRRQAIESKSIQQLDDKTNELLIRNAQNTATQSVAIARQAGGSSISVDTLKSTYETIKQGIEETKRINEELSQKRKQDSAELEHMKLEMKEKGFA